MSAEFILTTIGDQLTLQRGFDITKDKQILGTIPVVSSGGISSYHNEAKVSGPGVVLGRKGSLGTVFYIEEDFWPHDTSLWVKDFKGNNPRFIYYFFKSISEKLKKMDVGAANPALNRNHVHPIEIFWPNRKIQDGIVEMLSSLDQKIHLNTQTNQTLEQIAQAIFKNWFVDFDPVKAKIAALEAGGTQEASELAAMCVISGKNEVQLAQLKIQDADAYQQLAQTAALFPAAMQESELGEIPEGWGVSNVGECFDVTMGQSPPGSTYNEDGIGLPFFQGRTDFGFRYPTNRIYCTEPKRFGKKGHTLISVRAPVGDINIAAEDCCIGRGVASAIHRSDAASYTYYSMNRLSEHFKIFEGEGTVFGSINQKDFNAIPLLKQPEQLIKKFEKIVGKLDQEIRLASESINTLSQLRDSLLPKLLSGEIDLAELENSQKELVE